MKDINKKGARGSYSFSPYLKDYMEEKLKIEKMKKRTSDAGNQSIRDRQTCDRSK